jgi:hypothetical protein
LAERFRLFSQSAHTRLPEFCLSGRPEPLGEAGRPPAGPSTTGRVNPGAYGYNMPTSYLTQGPATAGAIALAPETRMVKGDCLSGPVLSPGTAGLPPQATRQNKASAPTDATMGSLSFSPPQDNLSCRQEILRNGFLERAAGLWYDSTVLEQTSRS